MKNMLSTENTLFTISRDGILKIWLTSRQIPEGEINRVLKMATMHARRKKTTKPNRWNKWWNGQFFLPIPTLTIAA